MDNILSDIFYNIWDANSFRGIYLLLKNSKQFNDNITYDDIKVWLASQPTYTKFKHAKIKFRRNPVVSKHINHIWFSDLIYIKNPKENDDYKYALLVIDNLSKKGYVQAVKDKTQNTIKKAFLDIFLNATPSIIITDPGPEFTNETIRLLFESKHIKHVILRDGSKASVVERWAGTLKNIIQKYLHANNTKRYIHVLQNIVDNYNHTTHSRTKFRPIDVNSNNEREVYNNLYRLKTIRERKMFEVGDEVRTALVRRRIETTFKPKFSNEIFIIHKVYQTFPYYKYRVKDKKGNLIRGSYYSSELVKVL